MATLQTPFRLWSHVCVCVCVRFFFIFARNSSTSYTWVLKPLLRPMPPAPHGLFHPFNHLLCCTVFTPKVVSTAVARYNFAARDMRELSLREGDIVKIYSKIGGDQGWWKGEANGRVRHELGKSALFHIGVCLYHSAAEFSVLFL